MLVKIGKISILISFRFLESNSISQITITYKATFQFNSAIRDTPTYISDILYHVV